MKQLKTRLLFVLLMATCGPVVAVHLINGAFPSAGHAGWAIAVVVCLLSFVVGIWLLRLALMPMTKYLTTWESEVSGDWKLPQEWMTGLRGGAPELLRLFEALQRLSRTNESTRKHMGQLVSRRTAKLEHSERRTRVSMEHLRAVVDGSPDAIAVINPDGDLVLQNAGLRGLLGDDETPASLSDIRAFLCEMYGNKSEAVAAWDGERFDDDHRLDMSWELPEMGGASLHAFSCPISEDDEGEGGSRLWILRDRTQARRFSEELQHNNRMEAVGRLAGGIAHDFNNILTALSGHLQLLRVRMGDSLAKEDRSALNTAESAATRGAELVNQLLRFSRKEQVETIPIQIAPIIEEVCDLLGHTIDPRIELIHHCDDDNIWAFGDSGQLEQVLLNLVVNARDAVESNGRIEIDCSEVDEVRGIVDSAEGDWIRISVRDDGAGMSPEIRDRIFEPFFTTKGQGKGTGFGLATAYAIVCQHGGSMECTSVTDVGTTFDIYLRKSAQPTEVAPVEETNDYQFDSACTVLVVDDEAAVRAVAEGSLRLAGIAVETASDGKSALACLEEMPIDLVLLDMTMPELSGTETFEALRLAGHHMPVIFCSGQRIDLDQIKDATGFRPNAVIQKPYSISELPERVRAEIVVSA